MIFQQYPLSELLEICKIRDIFVTATGNIDVIRKEHFRLMKDGAILANAGHFNVEISIKDLEELSKKKKVVKDYVTEYDLGEKKLYLLGEGRLVNLVVADGHPIEVMDMSFSNQALAVKYLVENHEKLERKVYPMPEELDKKVAKLKLKALSIEIDELNERQIKYLSDWRCGT